MADFPTIIYQAVADKEFRAGLQANPELALTMAGLRASADELDALSDMIRLLDLSPRDLLRLVLETQTPPWDVTESSQHIDSGHVALGTA